MFIHHYDNATGQYISSRLADADPRNADRWLVPAFSTDLPIPDRARDQWPFFIDGAWVLKPDYRGRVLYRIDDGTASEILAAGITPDDAGLTDKPRPSDQYVWRDGAWSIDPAIVSAQKRSEAMKLFEVLLGDARAANAGKADAYAAGVLSPFEQAMFKAWAAYQLDLVRVIESAGFPDDFSWPAKPDAGAIAAMVAEEAATMASAESAA